MKNIFKKPENQKVTGHSKRSINRHQSNIENSTRFKRKAILFGVSSLTASVVFAYCYCSDYMTQPTISSIGAEVSASTTALNTALTAHDSTIATQLEMQRQQVISAIKVMTLQKQAVGNNITDTTARAGQSFAAAYQAIKQNDKIQQTQLDYGKFGQGHKSCQVLAERVTFNNDVNGANNSVISRVSNEVIASPGKFGNKAQYEKAMLADHRQNYCTPDQAQSGLCSSTGKNPGLSLQASTLFTPAVEGNDIHKAQNALINNMLGSPDQEIDSDSAKSPIGVEYLQAKLEKDAVISPAVASMKTIQAYFVSQQVGTGHPTSGKPVIQQLRDQVSRYLGTGKEYKEWNITLTTSEERGILKEILQMKALQLQIGEMKYRQNERIEAILASLVALEQKYASGEYELNVAKSKDTDYSQRIALSTNIGNSVAKSFQ